MGRSDRRRRIGLALALTLLAGACGNETAETPMTPAETAATPTENGTPTSTSTSTSTPSASPTTSPPAAPSVSVFWSTGDGTDCAEVTGFERPVPAGTDPIEGAFAALVGGPDAAEESAGAGSFFSSATGGALLSASLDGDLLVVDLTDVRPQMNNASTSCGSTALLAQLNATAFQFPAVERVRYTIEGDCDVFFNWLQRDCTTFERDG